MHFGNFMLWTGLLVPEVGQVGVDVVARPLGIPQKWPALRPVDVFSPVHQVFI